MLLINKGVNQEVKRRGFALSLFLSRSRAKLKPVVFLVLISLILSSLSIITLKTAHAAVTTNYNFEETGNPTGWTNVNNALWDKSNESLGLQGNQVLGLESGLGASAKLGISGILPTQSDVYMTFAFQYKNDPGGLDGDEQLGYFKQGGTLISTVWFNSTQLKIDVSGIQTSSPITVDTSKTTWVKVRLRQNGTSDEAYLWVWDKDAQSWGSSVSATGNKWSTGPTDFYFYQSDSETNQYIDQVTLSDSDISTPYNTSADSWTIGPGQTYTTLAALKTALWNAGNVIGPGDTITGGNNSFSEVWTPDISGRNGADATFQNATVESFQFWNTDHVKVENMYSKAAVNMDGDSDTINRTKITQDSIGAKDLLGWFSSAMAGGNEVGVYRVVNGANYDYWMWAEIGNGTNRYLHYKLMWNGSNLHASGVILVKDGKTPGSNTLQEVIGGIGMSCQEYIFQDATGMFGNCHGRDTETNLTIAVDGQTAGVYPAEGTSNIVMTRTSALNDGTGPPANKIADVVTTYTITPTEGVRVKVDVTWAATVTIIGGYDDKFAFAKTDNLPSYGFDKYSFAGANQEYTVGTNYTGNTNTNAFYVTQDKDVGLHYAALFYIADSRIRPPYVINTEAYYSRTPVVTYHDTDTYSIDKYFRAGYFDDTDDFFRNLSQTGNNTTLNITGESASLNNVVVDGEEGVGTGIQVGPGLTVGPTINNTTVARCTNTGIDIDSGTTLYNSLFYNGIGIDIVGSANASGSHSAFQDSDPGNDSLTNELWGISDPFQGYDNGNFSLHSGSPAIDTGLDLNINTDYVGKQRYDDPNVTNTGSAGAFTKNYVDIGAYEYVTPPDPTFTSSSHPSHTAWYSDSTVDMVLSSSGSSTTNYHYLVSQNAAPTQGQVLAGTFDADGTFTATIPSDGQWYIHTIAVNLDDDPSTNYNSYLVKIDTINPSTPGTPTTTPTPTVSSTTGATATPTTLSHYLPWVTGTAASPSASFTTIPTDLSNIELGQSITFDATSSGNNISIYEWNFGDGDVSNEMKVEHKYDAPGRYTVTLTITDKSGNTSTVSKTIDIRPPVPTISDIKADGTSIIFEGKSFPNTTVNLTIHSNPYTVKTLADKDGKFSYTVENGSETLGDGDHTVLASAAVILSDNTELKGKDSKTYDFKVSVDDGKLKVEMGKTKTWKIVSFVLGGIIIIGLVVAVLRRKRRET